jgi:hypothetical protein
MALLNSIGQWLRGLSHGSADVLLLGLRVRIPLRAQMFVLHLHFVLSCIGRGLCNGLITCPEESHHASNCVWLRNLIQRRTRLKCGLQCNRKKDNGILWYWPEHLCPALKHWLLLSTKSYKLSFTKNKTDLVYACCRTHVHRSAAKPHVKSLLHCWSLIFASLCWY